MIVNEGRRAVEGFGGRNSNALDAGGRYIGTAARESEREGRVTLNRMHRVRRTSWN